MNKIWHLTAQFEDWESSWFLTIGYFTDKLEAEKVKNKWDVIFDEVLKLLEEPEGWDARQDEYYEHPYYVKGDPEWGLPDTYTLYWGESREYEKLLEKYEFVKHLSGFQIDEFSLDEDIFLKSIDLGGHGRKPLKSLLITLERDWKLNQLEND